MSKDTKNCSICKSRKSLKAFPNDKRANDGKQSRCKACQALYEKAYSQTEKGNASRRVANKVYRQSEKGATKRKAYEQSEEGRAKGKLRTRKYKELCPEKRRAVNVLNSAIRAGRLVRPNICEHCKQVCEIIHGHHPDYSKVLEVVWLCPRCHIEEHIRLEKGEQNVA